MLLDMKHKLPFLQGHLSAIRPLITGRTGQRAAIAALSIGGIDHRGIAIFTAAHLKTVRRWVCRVKKGRPLTDV